MATMMLHQVSTGDYYTTVTILTIIFRKFQHIIVTRWLGIIPVRGSTKESLVYHLTLNHHHCPLANIIMIPPGSDQTAHCQELGDDHDVSHCSFQPPPDSNVKMSEYEWSQWWDEMMNLLPLADSGSGWPDSDMRPAASLDIIAPLSHENESNLHNSSAPAPSQVHHTPTETPLALSSEEILALVMSFGDLDATDSAPEAGVTAVPHPYTLEVTGSDVHARLSNVRFDLPLSLGVPHPAAPLSTTSESLPPTSVLFGLESLPKVKLKAKKGMKQSMLDDSFLLSSKERSKKAIASLTAVVTAFNDSELTLWSRGSDTKKHTEKIGKTAKHLRKKVKDIVRTAVLFGYNLDEALATQTQEEIELTISNLLQGDAFLYGDIKVGGETIVGVPFANRVVWHFAQHVLFHQLDLQEYVNPSQDLGALFAFIGTLFEWALRELSTGVFIPSDFDLSHARVAFDEKLSGLYKSMRGDGMLDRVKFEHMDSYTWACTAPSLYVPFKIGKHWLRAKHQLTPQFSLISGWQSQPSILPGPFKEPSSVNVKRHSTPAINVAKSRATTIIVESTTSLAATKEPQATPETKQENNEESVMQDPGTSVASSRPCLHQLIISRIRNSGDGPEVEVFSNVTEDDYVYVLDAIGCDNKLIHKPSYIPSLHQIVTTLPSPIHESILVPLRTAMGIIVESLNIPDDFEVSLPIHMGRMVYAPATAELPPPQDETQGYHLGVLDLVLMFQTRDDDIHPFWPFEVSVSQTAEGAVVKLQKFGDQNEHVLATTHINITESRKHASLAYEWGVAKKLNWRGVQMGELTQSEDGALVLHSHTWYHPATATITTWIRPPNRRLNLNSRHHAYCASAVLYPNQNEQALAKVQNIFQCTLEQQLTPSHEGLVSTKGAARLEQVQQGPAVSNEADRIQSVLRMAPQLP
ncbi:hypothetical protein BDR06DRAFT_1054372 [Suillus hirtellus]|nr:hypothetical protein BDR06DRAFT_1054372 [Suillus hirtellus]